MKTKHIILALLSPLAFASCDYLDFDETSGLVTKENVYLYFNSTKQALTQVYSYMPQGYEAFTTLNTVNGEDFAMRDCASDDGEGSPLAIGYAATTSGYSTIAIGNMAQATGRNAIAIGSFGGPYN